MVIAGNVVRGRQVVGPIFFELTFNNGTAFGIGRGAEPVVEAAVAALVIGLVLVGWRVMEQASTSATIGLGLLAGGAVSNLSDRIFRQNGGAVIDFINALQINQHQLWPAFNVADSCIVVGAIIVAVAYYRSSRRHHSG